MSEALAAPSVDWRAPLRWFRHAPDRWRHPARREAARAAVAVLPRPVAILTICYGNICRSPYAEHRMRALAAGQGNAVGEIASAGFFGPGRPSPDMAQVVARERGVDLDSHRSQLVSAELVGRSDLVLVMTRAQRAQVRRLAPADGPCVLLLGDLDPCPIERREIADPYGRPAEEFRRCFERIDRSLAVLLDVLASPRA